jgi:hypothetical protein
MIKTSGNSRRSTKGVGRIPILTTVLSVILTMTTLAASSAAHAKPSPAGMPPNPCDMIKGKTYIAFTVGQFDNHPLAGAAGKWTFDSQGNGLGRSLIVYEPTDQTVLQQLPTVTCTLTSEGIGLLSFMVGPTSAGNAKFWPHDHGARLWVEPTTPGRPMNGWMLQLPEPPARNSLNSQ